MKFAPLALCAVLAACASSPDTLVRVAAPPLSERISIGHASLLVRTVSLPTYAASEEIHRQGADGALTSSPTLRWADEPERAITLELSRALAELTRARVAPDPWPFGSDPGAEIDVRIEDLLAGSDGALLLSGQYFVSSESGRERSGIFRLTVPLAPEAGAGDIAKARGEAVQQLARQIARTAL
ncbi:MAG: PqiC family protein [Alphaproteobacteria bacterium]|nr:PqiC family protein [Alphaproteobacteria bacterium]NNF24676.1 membrane integrity-associated transporter subunit PqiC [Paracoccaceae bacterium]